MNERIRELAEQAGITTNLDTDYFEKDINKWIDYYSEKFAELIIKECLGDLKERIALRYQGSDRDRDIGYGMEIVYYDIVDKFGVES